MDVDTFYVEGCLFPETTEVPRSVWDPCQICLVLFFEAAGFITMLGPYYCSLWAREKELLVYVESLAS